MNFSESSVGKQKRIELGETIDEIGAEELEAVFKQIDPRSTAEVILDFKHVRYIGSAGVGTLLLLYKRLAPHNGRVVLENIPRDIYRMLDEDMNLGQVLTLSSV